MKKLLFSLFLTLCAAFASYANSFHVINYTNCTYVMSTQAGYLTVTSPAGGSNEYYFPTGNYFGAKIMRDGLLAYQISVGTLPLAPTSQTILSTIVGDTPACNGNLPYTIFYTVNNALDVVILIL